MVPRLCILQPSTGTCYTVIIKYNLVLCSSPVCGLCCCGVPFTFIKTVRDKWMLTALRKSTSEAIAQIDVVPVARLG